MFTVPLLHMSVKVWDYIIMVSRIRLMSSLLSPKLISVSWSLSNEVVLMYGKVLAV